MSRAGGQRLKEISMQSGASEAPERKRGRGGKPKGRETVLKAAKSLESTE